MKLQFDSSQIYNLNKIIFFLVSLYIQNTYAQENEYIEVGINAGYYSDKRNIRNNIYTKLTAGYSFDKYGLFGEYTDINDQDGILGIYGQYNHFIDNDYTLSPIIGFDYFDNTMNTNLGLSLIINIYNDVKFKLDNRYRLSNTGPKYSVGAGFSIGFPTHFRVLENDNWLRTRTSVSQTSINQVVNESSAYLRRKMLENNAKLDELAKLEGIELNQTQFFIKNINGEMWKSMKLYIDDNLISELVILDNLVIYKNKLPSGHHSYKFELTGFDDDGKKINLTGNKKMYFEYENGADFLLSREGSVIGDFLNVLVL
ncbi:hypothetical protein [Photobacterium damselae]|uniref:hypothetical protein n=1 Tax=Photobacterium damselae TaxID=38293 RepID=UPI0040690EAE